MKKARLTSWSEAERAQSTLSTNLLSACCP
jgi:hypothetical protein